MNENIAAVVFEDVGMSGGPWGFFFFFYWFIGGLKKFETLV